MERVVPLRSPYDGFVIEKNVILGQRIMAGEPLYRLADLAVVWVEGEVFEQDLPLVRLGVAVMATFQALPGVERAGRVTYIYPTVDPATRTARIRVELGNADLALKPGMYGQLQFDGRIGDGLTVPRSALIVTGTRNLVFIKRRDGRFEPREIVLGAATPERVQVIRGLAAGRHRGGLRHVPSRRGIQSWFALGGNGGHARDGHRPAESRAKATGLDRKNA